MYEFKGQVELMLILVEASVIHVLLTNLHSSYCHFSAVTAEL